MTHSLLIPDRKETCEEVVMPMGNRSSLGGAFIVFKALVATPFVIATDINRTLHFVAIN